MAKFYKIGGMEEGILGEKECDALLVCCIDFRFYEAIIGFVKEALGIVSFDILALAGGVRSLSDPLRPSFKEVALENIRASKKTHNIKKIILANHIDCLTYGGSKVFSTQEQEKEFHHKELKQAKKIIKEDQILSDLEVILLYADKKGEEIDCAVFEGE